MRAYPKGGGARATPPAARSVRPLNHRRSSTGTVESDPRALLRRRRGVQRTGRGCGRYVRDGVTRRRILQLLHPESHAWCTLVTVRTRPCSLLTPAHRRVRRTVGAYDDRTLNRTLIGSRRLIIRLRAVYVKKNPCIRVARSKACFKSMCHRSRDPIVGASAAPWLDTRRGSPSRPAPRTGHRTRACGHATRDVGQPSRHSTTWQTHMTAHVFNNLTPP